MCDPGAQLHSRYNPQAEAGRYIDALNLREEIGCFILIEPGRGYLVQALRDRFKNSKIILLHIDNSFLDENLISAGVAAWYGTDGVSVQDFLEREIPEADASRIRIIEWRPSMYHYREAYLALLSQVVDYVKRIDSERRTVSAFGRRWVRNFFRNLGNVRQTVYYRSAEIPVIVTGSGPSLETALPVIRHVQNECVIISASSSILALAHGGVAPDIVIASDGGGWALRHIYPYIRSGIAGDAGFFAANLCAAIPSQCGALPYLLINDGSLWQTIVLHELALPSVVISQKGTVTAQAVELAFLLSGGDIYLAGVDLSVRDMRAHARPYGFDHLFFESASRFVPVYSTNFVRSGLIRNGGSYGIYSAWFKNQLGSWPKRVFSLSDDHEIFEKKSFKTSGKKNKREYFDAARVNGDPACFCERGAAALVKAFTENSIAENSVAGNLKQELMPLLFPGERDIPNREIETAIVEIAHRYSGRYGQESHG